MCGKLANDGVDTRALQHYLGHRNITHTVLTFTEDLTRGVRFGRPAPEVQRIARPFEDAEHATVAA